MSPGSGTDAPRSSTTRQSAGGSPPARSTRFRLRTWTWAGRCFPTDPPCRAGLGSGAAPGGRLRTGWCFRIFDADGALCSLQARSVESDPKPGEKAANPTGAHVAGLVFADGLALQLLRGERTEPTDVVIVEGAPDYLTWATRWGTDGALEDAPAVFGVVAGSWRGAQGQALGRRIPSGSRVVIRTHHDAAGDRYAEEICKTLRHCQVRRGGAA